MTPKRPAQCQKTRRLDFTVNRTYRIITTLLLFHSAGAVANCYIDDNGQAGDGKPRVINFSAPSTLNIPADSSSLTVLDVTTSGLNKHIRPVCIPEENSGFQLNPALGSQPAKGTVFTLRNTGLDLRLRIEGFSAFFSKLDPQPSFIAKTGMLIKDGPYRLFLIKNRTIEPGTTIPAGLLGTWVTSSGYVIASFNLLNPINVVAASCTVNDVNVAMGNDYRLHQLENVGDTTPPVAFKIPVVGCDKSINKIQIRLSATTPIVDKDTGTVELDQYSTARGIGLKITNALVGNILMDKTYTLSSFTSGAETAEANFFAAYTRIPGAEFRAGSANTSINFVMSYL